MDQGQCWKWKYVILSYTDENDNQIGFDIDLFRAIAEDQGINFEFQPLGFEGAGVKLGLKGIVGGLKGIFSPLFGDIFEKAPLVKRKDLQEILVNTDEHILCEASPYDKIWGIGMAADNKNVYNPSHWHSDAQNLLGFALMEVRDKIIGK